MRFINQTWIGTNSTNDNRLDWAGLFRWQNIVLFVVDNRISSIFVSPNGLNDRNIEFDWIVWIKTDEASDKCVQSNMRQWNVEDADDDDDDNGHNNLISSMNDVSVCLCSYI